LSKSPSHFWSPLKSGIDVYHLDILELVDKGRKSSMVGMKLNECLSHLWALWAWASVTSHFSERVQGTAGESRLPKEGS
jgi:hypothetical protein